MLQKRTLLVAALAASLASSASATLIAYEGFNYTEANGTTITGLNGGTGWDQAYPTVEGTIRLGDGLSFTGHLASAGKSIERLQSATMSADGRNWETALATGTIWYSFLMNPTATGRGTFGVVQGAASNQNGFGIRFEPSTTTLQINANTPNQNPGTNITFANGYGQTYLVVGKLTIDTAANTRNDVWAWQNGQTVPTNLTNASVGMSHASFATGASIPALYGRAFGSPNAAVFFDEVRIGTTFGDVAIPEPSSFAALAGLGVLGMVASRRRRQA
jgi:hypothetical protein